MRWDGQKSIARAGNGRRFPGDHYEDVPCFYSMTVPLDVTRLRAAGLRLYPAMLYLLSRAVNRHEEFRYALVNGEVGVYGRAFPLLHGIP